MAGAKEIRTKISSIKNTQKITKAMEMVAASKMRRAQERMQASKPYAKKIRAVISHLAQANSEYQHPFMVAREEVRRVAYIIVTTDRGLCGGLNVNLMKKAVNDMKVWLDKDVKIDLCVIGKKGAAFFRRFGANIVSTVSDLGDKPDLQQLIGAVKVMLDAYSEGQIDRLFLVQNEFVNTMTQRAEVLPLLPLPGSDEKQGEHQWDYIYEPSAEVLLDSLLVRYIESLVYQAAVENVACEMAARMVAMKSATDNAGDFIQRLQLAYNKARQAAITQEISEIVGGAAAV